LLMRQFYMDTNVFIAQLKPDDPYYLEAKTIAQQIQDNEIQAETSVLTLVETASVASRLYHASKRGEKGNNRERKAFTIKLLRRLTTLTTRFIHIAGDSPIAVRSIKTNLPEIFNEAIILSLQTPLRTFDLMHLAAAKHAKQMNPELAAFVTGDGEFLSRKQELSKIIKIAILSPKEYVDALGLKQR